MTDPSFFIDSVCMTIALLYEILLAPLRLSQPTSPGWTRVQGNENMRPQNEKSQTLSLKSGLKKWLPNLGSNQGHKD